MTSIKESWQVGQSAGVREVQHNVDSQTELDVFLNIPKMHLARVYIAASELMEWHRTDAHSLADTESWLASVRIADPKWKKLTSLLGQEIKL